MDETGAYYSERSKSERKTLICNVCIDMHILTHFKKMVMMTLYAKQQETQMLKTGSWTLWEKVRVG